MLAAPVGAAQTVRASRDAPSRRNSVASLVSCVSRPFEPPYEYGRIDSPPHCVARLAHPLGDQASASSHETRVEAGQPLRSLADRRIEQAIGAVDPLGKAADLGADVAAGDRIDVRAVDGGDAPVLHRDVEAARVGAVERADGGDDVLGRERCEGSHQVHLSVGRGARIS